MSKYKKKPIVIEAEIWNGHNLGEIKQFLGFLPKTSGKDKIKIPTLEGIMTANAGDYIIKGILGEFYPCKPDIFEKTYAKIE